MKGVFKGWMSWGSTDSKGSFYVDKNGVPSKQVQCIDPNEMGTWSEWSAEGPCEGTCPDNSFHKHRRTCLGDYCGDGPTTKNGRKCLRVELEERLNPTEPALQYRFIEKVTEGRQCSVGISNVDIDVWTEFNGQESHRVFYNHGDYCHFPSFGKGWFDQVMDNGDHVQMGVECENEWNYADYSIAKKGEKCRLICKNLSGTENVYEPKQQGEVVEADSSVFYCRSPIPIFAFQNSGCHKELIKAKINDVYWCEYDFFTGNNVCDDNSYGYYPDEYYLEESNSEKNERYHTKVGPITGCKGRVLCDRSFQNVPIGLCLPARHTFLENLY